MLCIWPVSLSEDDHAIQAILHSESTVNANCSWWKTLTVSASC